MSVDDRAKLQALTRWFRESVAADDLLSGWVDGFELVHEEEVLEPLVELIRCEGAVPLVNVLREPTPRSVDVVARIANAMLHDATVTQLAVPRLEPTVVAQVAGVTGLVFSMHWKSRPLHPNAHGFTQALRLDEVIAVRRSVPCGRYVIETFDARPEGEDGRLAGALYRVGDVRPEVTMFRVSDIASIQQSAR
jgi:hypothetical protein